MSLQKLKLLRDRGEPWWANHLDSVGEMSNSPETQDLSTQNHEEIENLNIRRIH